MPQVTFPVPLRIAFSTSGTWRVSTQTIDLLHTTCSYKHQARSSRTPPRDIDFSDVSLKTLLVLVHRRILRPSHVHLLGGATVSRPDHRQPQWFAINSLWAAAWATTMLFYVVEQVTGPKSSTSSFQCIHHDVLQPVQYDTTKIFLWLLSSAVSAILFCNILIAFCRDRL